MAVAFNELPRLLLRTFVEPAAVMRQLMDARYDRITLWSALILAAILSALSLELTMALTPMPEGQTMAQPSAAAFALIVGSFLTMLVFAIFFIGQMLGGQGTFPHVLLMMAWFQMIAVSLQFLQAGIAVLAPGLLGFATFLGMAWLIFIALHLLNVVEGFGSLLKAFGTFLIAIVGVAFGLAILLTLIGATAAVGGT